MGYTPVPELLPWLLQLLGMLFPRHMQDSFYPLFTFQDSQVALLKLQTLSSTSPISFPDLPIRHPENKFVPSQFWRPGRLASRCQQAVLSEKVVRRRKPAPASCFPPSVSFPINPWHCSFGRSTTLSPSSMALAPCLSLRTPVMLDKAENICKDLFPYKAIQAPRVKASTPFDATHYTS